MLVYHSLNKAAPAPSPSKPFAVSQFLSLVKHIDTPLVHYEPTYFSI